MPVLSALLLRVRAPRNDYLRIAIVLSLAIHAAVLAVHFSAPARPQAQTSTLEVTLVNARSEAPPINPKMLAQDQLNGGGQDQAGQASSPLPRTVTESADQVVLAALQKRQEELEAEQIRLFTQLTAQQKVRAERKQPDLFEESRDPGEDARSQESLVLNAQISALKERIEQYNAQPRQQFSGPSTQAVDYAAYVEAWRQKIELLGTEHYPEEARGKVYGSLQLTVYINQDGSVRRIDIDHPSDQAILNLAATRIVQLAAPFAPLPHAIAKNTDVFAITRTWNFTNQQLETTTP
ncbi:TonB family protein [Alcaligenaceae bacterium]|nr:TonB family protein [Alcaligenaceae bacterium]